MADTQENQRFVQLIQKFFPQSTLLRLWRLTGGISAQATALEITLPDDSTKKVVVRQHSDVDRAHNPNIAVDESRLLQILQSAGLPVPMPVTVDDSCQIFPIPVIVVNYIEGEIENAPTNLDEFIWQSATMLTFIHAVDIEKYDVSFLPKKTFFYEKRAENMDADLDEEHIQQVLAAAMPLSSLNPPCLLHGDFWTGNWLWRNNKLVGVIDWEDAAIGDPLADIAKTRLEMLWEFGLEVMHKWTEQYQSIAPGMDFSQLPYWDLSVALRVIPKFITFAKDAAHEKRLREGIRLFVQQALKNFTP